MVRCGFGHGQQDILRVLDLRFECRQEALVKTALSRNGESVNYVLGVVPERLTALA